MTIYPGNHYRVGEVIPMEWPRTDLWSRTLRVMGLLRTEQRDYRVIALRDDGGAQIEPV